MSDDHTRFEVSMHPTAAGVAFALLIIVSSGSIFLIAGFWVMAIAVIVSVLIATVWFIYSGTEIRLPDGPD